MSKFENICPDSSSLIIASGPSTTKILKYQNVLKNFFDTIIVVSSAIRNFEHQADFHISMEVNINTKELYLSGSKDNYRKDLPRIISVASVSKFPKDLNIFPVYRRLSDDNFNIKKFKNGLLNGPPHMQTNGRQLRVGTSALQALHFACILGSANIYLIGADFIFEEKFDHYYKDRAYRDGINNNDCLYEDHQIISVECNNKKYETIESFYNGAKYIDNIIKTLCAPIGINVYDFSDGLLKNTNKINIYEFFMEKKNERCIGS